MECHDIQQLLAFVNRKCEELDAPERAALREHLEKCPDCTAISHAERHADETLGRVLRDVLAPADLKQKVMKRLAAERGVAQWHALKRVAPAAAAVLLCVIFGGTAWHLWPLPDVSVNDAVEFARHDDALVEKQWSEEQARNFLADRGLRVQLPDEFDFRFLRQVEVAEFKNRRVAKLSFLTELQNGQTAKADVLILPHRQFRVDKLPVQDVNDATNLRFLHRDDFTYVIFYRDNIDLLLRLLN